MLSKDWDLLFLCSFAVLLGLPELAKVIKAADELGIDIRYSFGSRPALLMYKTEDDSQPESIPVHSWDLESFKEYLSSHLQTT